MRRIVVVVLAVAAFGCRAAPTGGDDVTAASSVRTMPRERPVPLSALVPEDSREYERLVGWWDKGHDLTEMTWLIRIESRESQVKEVTAAEYVAPFFEPLEAARLRLRGGEFAEAVRLLKEAREVMVWMPYPPGDEGWVRMCDRLIAAASAIMDR